MLSKKLIVRLRPRRPEASDPTQAAKIKGGEKSTMTRRGSPGRHRRLAGGWALTAIDAT